MKFAVSSTDGYARRGELQFRRGVVQTPAFKAAMEISPSVIANPIGLLATCLSNLFQLFGMEK